MLLVGLNLLFLIPGETGGMETAARETIPHLAAIDDLRLTLFVNREAAGTFGGAAEEVVVPVNATSRIQWVRGEQQHIPTLAARHGCQIVHSLGSTAPLRGALQAGDHHPRPELPHGAREPLRAARTRHARARARRRAALGPNHRGRCSPRGTTCRDLLKVDPRKVDVVPLGVTAAHRAGHPAGRAARGARPRATARSCSARRQAPAQERSRCDRGARA